MAHECICPAAARTARLPHALHAPATIAGVVESALVCTIFKSQCPSIFIKSHLELCLLRICSLFLCPAAHTFPPPPPQIIAGRVCDGERVRGPKRHHLDPCASKPLTGRCQTHWHPAALCVAQTQPGVVAFTTPHASRPPRRTGFLPASPRHCAGRRSPPSPQQFLPLFLPLSFYRTAQASICCHICLNLEICSWVLSTRSAPQGAKGTVIKERAQEQSALSSNVSMVDLHGIISQSAFHSILL